ncbi:cubilin-like [Haliotis rufescens]|uniref:cubilin-like n=1 Tax=Haliotis rufescens TaxID=6454 RepID=UPI00201E7870|nr:cubilin-like [Haliotis rufescens]
MRHTMALHLTAVVLLGILSPVLASNTDACFEDIQLSNVVENITSPGFPSSSGPNISCGWRIHASFPEHLVGVKYVALLDYSVRCQGDILSFYDGPDNSTEILLELCGDGASTGSVISSGDTMYIQFTTGAITDGVLFRLNVSDVESCGGNLTATSEEANFTSPGFPHTYYKNQKCTWIISAENENDTVKVTNNLPNKDNYGFRCWNVYNGNTTEAAQFLGELCPSQKRIYYSSNNAMLLEFTITEAVTSKDFQLHYTAIPEGDCNRTYYIYDTPIYIQSPGYPDSYDSDLECVMIIFDARRTPNIKLDVLTADIEGDYPQCDTDAVTLFGGDYRAYHPIGEFCGNSSISPVGPYYSNGMSMKLVFKSNSDTSGKGFQVVVSRSSRKVIPYQSENCGPRFLNATTYPKSLHSPGYPLHPLSNADCIWILTAPDPNMMVRIVVNDSDIQTTSFFHYFCERNRVTVYDGPSIFNNTLFSGCGHSSPTLQSSGPAMTVQFYNRHANNMTGFNLKYFATNEAYICGGTVNITTDEETTLTETYDNSQGCHWTIHAPVNTNIQVNFSSSNRNVGIFTECLNIYGYLEIYDGNYDNTTSTTPGKWCGQDNAGFISSGNIITARFYPGIFNRYRGLKMILKAGHFKASRQKNLSADFLYHYITSPNYPFNYPSNIESTWKIDAGEGHHVEIVVIYSRLESSSGCQNDYMEAFDGSDSDAQSLGRWCGVNQPTKSGSGTVMFLKFKTNSHTVDRGFKISYTAQINDIDLSSGSSVSRVGAIIGSSTAGVSLILTVIAAICRTVGRNTASRTQDARNNVRTTDQRPIDAIIPPATFSSPETFNMERTSSRL